MSKCTTTERRFGKGDRALFGRLFHPCSSSQGVKMGVVVSTGVHQHAGLYRGFAERLASEGIMVLTYDHRGFGQSDSYSGLARSQVAEWLDLDVPSVVGDLADAVDELAAAAPGAKIYVWGHSLGGLAGAILATSGRSNAAGFILSNPTVNGTFAPPEKVAEWEAMDADAVIAGAEAMQASACCLNTVFYPWWTTDPEVSAIVEPNLPFKAAYLAGAGRAIAEVRTRLGAFEAPALVLRGGKDIEVHEAHGTADLWRDASPSAPLALLSYPEHGHDVLFDSCAAGTLSMSPGQNDVADDVVAWLRREARLRG
eukprot:SAG31_NODE_3760_length_3909_cov_2.157743_2_plen_312_part_00